MQEWFECKVKFDKEVEEGKVKSTPEVYLLEAVNYTDAEQRIYEEVRPYVPVAGAFDVAGLKRVKYADIHPSTNENDSFWFRVKIIDLIPDEEKGIERRVPSVELVQASSLPEAIQYTEKFMGTTSRTYEIASVNITPILDVLPLALDGGPRKPLTNEAKMAQDQLEQEALSAELQAAVEE